MKDDVSDVAVIFDEDRLMELRQIFYSTTLDNLSCKRDMEEIIILQIMINKTLLGSFY